MADPLTAADVDRVATLAQLELTDEERRTFVGQLNEILGYAQQIQSLDTTGVEATSHVLAGHSADRADELRPSLPITDALEDAPEAAPEAGLFKVPRVIGTAE
jgi:aspartyl-tRNA(Asn)/glutamyl-tRNA(Gln) amidotransferase subunit C